MSEDPFDSAEFEATWGAVKAHDLTALREAFFGTPNTCIKITELNPETGNYEVKIRVTRPLPLQARGIVADALRSFRNALDQAVFAAARMITNKQRPRNCHFPFGESPDDLENSLSRRRAPQCRGIPEQLFPVLRACNPYPRGDGYSGGNNALRALGRVSGPHKHEVTLVVGGAPKKHSILPGVISVGEGGGYLHADGWNYAKNELVMFSFPPGGYFEADVEVAMTIAFGPGPLNNVDAVAFLHTLANDVSKRVGMIKKAAVEIGGA